MPAKRRTVQRPRTSAVPPPPGRLAGTLRGARQALAAAEARLERRLHELIQRTGVDTRPAGATLTAWRGRLERERVALGRVVEDRVRAALAALDIPSRREMQDLRRQVAELTRKVDARRRRSR